MIRVDDYDPAWADRFEGLKHDYLSALDRAEVRLVGIEHVGSTAVPGLAAKPIIDVDIIVDESKVPAASAALETLGFRPLGELGIPQRWAFKEPDRLTGTNTYVVVAGSLSLRNHLAVRDLLRHDQHLRDRYAAVKRQVAADAANIDDYGHGKNDIIQEILEAAGLNEADRKSVQDNRVPSHQDLPR